MGELLLMQQDHHDVIPHFAGEYGGYQNNVESLNIISWSSLGQSSGASYCAFVLWWYVSHIPTNSFISESISMKTGVKQGWIIALICFFICSCCNAASHLRQTSCRNGVNLQYCYETHLPTLAMLLQQGHPNLSSWHSANVCFCIHSETSLKPLPKIVHSRGYIFKD